VAREGAGVLFMDHNILYSLSISDRAYILQDGRITRVGPPWDPPPELRA